MTESGLDPKEHVLQTPSSPDRPLLLLLLLLSRFSHVRLCATPAGSLIPGILQARVLEWGAIAFSEMAPSLPLIALLWIVGLLSPAFGEGGRPGSILKSEPPLPNIHCTCPSPGAVNHCAVASSWDQVRCFILSSDPC